jgi:hypothetical protein
MISVMTILAISLTSCEKLFNNLEGDLTKMTAEDMSSTEAGLQRLLAQVYSYIPMNAFQYSDQYTMNATDSHGGDYGFNSNPYYGMYGITAFWDWAGIRTINSFIQTVSAATEKGVITEAACKSYVAEARFVRAYCYFAMVRALGGVPIITEPLDKYYDGVGNEKLFEFATRATEKDTWDFVLSELQAAADDLGETPVTEFRADKYAALGLKARVALYAASVSKYWDRQGAIDSKYKAVAAKKTYMEASYASNYYNQCIAACEAIIASGKFSLYGANPSSVEAAVKNLGDMFLTKMDNEYIFGKSLNDGVASSGSNFDVYNSPCQTVTGNSSCGKYSVTIDFVDKFDNYNASFGAVDGTVKTRADGKENEYFNAVLSRFPAERKNINYIKYNNISDPFINKDARFQAWVLYPDATFRGQTIKLQGGLIKTDGSVSLWIDDSETVGGKTYYSFGGPTGNISGFFNYENKMAGNTITTGFGLRKFLNPQSFQLYTKTFWCDIRYAEILLSYCEAVVENNVSAKSAIAKGYLNDIRHRAAFKDNVDLTLDNVLHQRELEFAFEGDQIYTLHRRRAFYNKRNDPESAGSKHALTPVLDLSSGSPKYIFVRSIFYAEDPLTGGKASDYHTDYIQYYKKISDFGVNKFEPNPADE